MRLRILACCAMAAVSVAALTGLALISSGSEEPPALVAGTVDAPQELATVDARELSRFVPFPATPVTPRYREGVTPVRLVLPTVSINASVIVGGIDTVGMRMIAPEDPDEVAWYDYFPIPGNGGNAIFAGHLDYVGHGPAIFWRLRDTRVGDTITVELSDGALLTYQVDLNKTYPVEGTAWGELFAPDVGQDVITLYTCDGALSAGRYDERRVIRAVLVDINEANVRPVTASAS